MRRRHRKRPARELRTAIDSMPLRTREAMLDGIGTTAIIVGGYSDGQGGICPMLAAHRNGGRTAFASFAHAWDRYTGADGQARRATDRELGTLRSMLEASIEAEEVVGQGVLGEAVQQHRHAQQARARREEFEVEPLEPLPGGPAEPARSRRQDGATNLEARPGTAARARTRRPAAGTGSPARDTPAMSPAGT